MSYNKFIKTYMNLISQQVDMIDDQQIVSQQEMVENTQIDLSKVLTLDQFEKIKEINRTIAMKRTSMRVNTSFFVELAQRKPIILLAATGQKYTLPAFTERDFCGVQMTAQPWIPVISLFLQANHRTYNDMTKEKPVPNVFPIIYAPTYVTDQFETYGQNKSSHDNNDAYWGTDWIPDPKTRTRACSILKYAYTLLGDINIMINDNGNLTERPLKELWNFASNKKTGQEYFVRKAYPNVFQDEAKYKSQLVKDYGRYGFREEKIARTAKKLIAEKKESLRR